MVRSRKSKKLTNRQLVVLKTLKKLVDADVRKESPWYGAFGAMSVSLVTGETPLKIHNDLQGLKDAGFVDKELNLLWRINKAGEKELEDERGI